MTHTILSNFIKCFYWMTKNSFLIFLIRKKKFLQDPLIKRVSKSHML